MDQPAVEIRTVICRLLDSADPDAVVTEVERVYSADAVLEAPLFIWKGRDKIAQVWRTWSHWNHRFEHVSLLDMAVSRHPPVDPHVVKTHPVPGHSGGTRQRLYLDLSFSFQPVLSPALHTQRVLTILDLRLERVGGREAWLIIRQEDLTQPNDSVCALLPPPISDVIAALLALLQSLIGLVLAYVVEPLLCVVRQFGGVLDKLKPWKLLWHWWRLRPVALQPRPASPGAPPYVYVPLVPHDASDRDGMVTWLGALLNRDPDRAVSTVTASFTPQAQLLHPLAHFQSRQDVTKIYSVVSRACRDITGHSVHDMAVNIIDDTHRRMFLDMSYCPQPLWDPSAAFLRLVVTLDLEKVAGRWLVSRQVDYIQPVTLVRAGVAGLRGRVAFGLARVVEVVVGLVVLHTVFPAMRAAGKALKHPHNH